MVVSPPLDSDPRPARTAITLIVMHSTAKGEVEADSAAHAIQILRERELSYHYIIAKSGAVYQCIDPQLRARHAGSSFGPREKALGLSRQQRDDYTFEAGTSVNDYSIGISFVNLDDGLDPFTDEQTRVAVELITSLQKELGSLTHITSHAAVSPKRKVDPLGYDMAGLAKATGLSLWE